MIKWMTSVEVQEAASKSDEAALAKSIEHYDQMLSATEEEFRKALKDRKVGIKGSYCALCQRATANETIRPPSTCALKQNCNYFCIVEWRTMKNAVFSWQIDKTSWRKVKKAMRAVRTKLLELT